MESMESITTTRDEILRGQQPRWIASYVNLGDEEGSAGTGRVLSVEEGRTSGYGVAFAGNALFRFERRNSRVTEAGDVEVNVSFPIDTPGGGLRFGTLTCRGWINREVFDL